MTSAPRWSTLRRRAARRGEPDFPLAEQYPFSLGVNMTYDDLHGLEVVDVRSAPLGEGALVHQLAGLAHVGVPMFLLQKGRTQC